MANPKKRHSTSRTGSRRANWRLILPNVIDCPNCHQPRLPHQACGSCGFYGGQPVVKVRPPKAERVKAKEGQTAKA